MPRSSPERPRARRASDSANRGGKQRWSSAKKRDRDAATGASGRGRRGQERHFAARGGDRPPRDAEPRPWGGSRPLKDSTYEPRGSAPKKRGRYDRDARRDERRRDWTDRSRDDRGRDDRGGKDWNRDDRGRANLRDDRWAGERPARENRGFDDRPARENRRGEERPARDNRRGEDRPARDNRGFDDRRGRDDRRQGRRWEERPAREHSRQGRDDRPQRDNRRWDDRRDNRPSDDEQTADQMEWTPTEVSVDDTLNTEGAAFAELGLPDRLVAALHAQGITHPFPIQAAAIPDALNGRDVLGRGRTGSGKTLAFGLPLLSRLAKGGKKSGRRPVRAVVMVPTRELALQVADVISPLATLVGLNTTLIAGGMSYGPQIRAFERGVDIVVATPGRLIDLMNQEVADLGDVEVVVLDEADHMADLGFMPDMTTILDAVPEGQRMLFSATLDRGVDTLVKRYLHDPITHQVDSDQASVTTMRHVVLHVLPHDKNQMTADIAGREGKTVVFVRTQRGADRVAQQLRAAGVTAGALHGGLTQGARSRVLAAFKAGTVPVLVATDVAARGIHVDDVGLVLQVDPPDSSKDYLHRAGRTARAGDEGVVVSIVLPHQRREVARLTSHAGVHAEPVKVTPGEPLVHELTGARSRADQPVSEEHYASLVAPQQPKRAHRKPSAWGRGGQSSHRRGPRRERW